MPKRSYKSGLHNRLRDEEYSVGYVNAAKAESTGAFLVALRDCAEVKTMAKVAAEAGVSRESIYRMLRKTGNPTIANLLEILKALGFDFDIKPKDRSPQPRINPFAKSPLTEGGSTRAPGKAEVRARAVPARSESLQAANAARRLSGAPAQARTFRSAAVSDKSRERFRSNRDCSSWRRASK